MIKGLTHDESGVANQVVKYKGKISAGYNVGEGPNKENHPVASGFYRVMSEVTINERVGASQKVIPIKKWVLNTALQTKLEEINSNSTTPRLLSLVCLNNTVEDMWESSCCMFNSSGLACKSHGEGTPAKMLKKLPGDKREWEFRSFNGKPGCAYKECPDYKSGDCTECGTLKVYPTFDMAPNPYRFDTKSLNTILNIESALDRLWNLIKMAHAARVREAGKDLPFDGFFGARLVMKLDKIKSGGRDVWVTSLFPAADYVAELMDPIKRWMEARRNVAALPGAAGSMSLLDLAASKMIGAPEAPALVDMSEPPLANAVEERDVESVSTDAAAPEAPTAYPGEGPTAAATEALLNT